MLGRFAEIKEVPVRILVVNDMVKKYVMLGAILFTLSFIVRFSLYMRLTASLAFCAAGACMVLNEYSVRKKMKR